MKSRRHIVLLAFAAATGITFLVLGCALYFNWWPMFVLIFYFLSPVPTFICRRYAEDTTSSALVETCLFLTAAIVVSAYGLPIVLAHAPLSHSVIQWQACALVLSGNTVVFLTILAYFFVFSREDSFDYTSW